MTKKYENLVNVTIEGKEWKDAVDKAFKEKVKDLTIDGFRKGKAPRDVFEKKYGKESLYYKACDYVTQTAYTKALTDSKLIPVTMPKLDIKEVNDEKITFEFKIITKPDVKVKKYKGLKVTKDEVKVTKEEIEHEISHLLEEYKETREKNGAIADKDIAIIDFEGFKDGVAFEGGKGENYELAIGSNTFIPGFEEGLIGLKKDDTKDLELTFPEDYPHEELKGAKVVFKVKVNEVKEVINREFDKELFEDLAIEGVDSKEKLEKHVEEDIKSHKDDENERNYIDKLLEEVSKNVEVDIPEEMVEEEIDSLVERFGEQLKMQGISIDMYYAFTKSTENDLRTHFEKEAYSHVLYRLMLEEIKTQEKIEITDEDVEKEAEDSAKKYNMKKEDFIKAMGGKDMVRYDLEVKKTIDLLKELNK